MRNVTHRCNRFRRKPVFIIAAATLVAALYGGCSDSKVSGGDVASPTVDPLPAKTNNPNHKITGTRALNSSIWIQYEGKEQSLLAQAGAERTWEGRLDLDEGNNRFVVFASYKGDAGVSAPTGPIEIILDTIPPSPPVVTNAPGVVSLGEQASMNLSLLGTKDANSDLRLGPERSEVVVALNAAMEWATEVVVSEGANSITLSSADDVGNVSEPRVVSIFGSNVQAPTFDPIPQTPTREKNPVLSGTKSANSSVYLKHTITSADGSVEIAMAGDEIVALSTATTWTYSDILLGEGTNTLEIFSRIEGGDYPSGTTVATVVLDTIPPALPVLDAFSETTDLAAMTFTGSKAQDGNLCLRREQEASCQEIASIESGTEFSVEIAMNTGANNLYFSSVDAVGNASREVAAVVFRVGGPKISFVRPQNGDAITSGTFVIEVDVLGRHCSHDFNVGCSVDADCGTNSQCIAQTALDTVQICVDSEPCDEVAVDASTGTYLVDYSAADAGWASGSAHTIVCQATNLAGFTTTESVEVIYTFGVTNLSNTLTPGHSRDVAMAVEEDGTLHFVWSDQCIQYGFGNTGILCRDSQSGNSPNDIFHRSFGVDGWSPIALISDAGGVGNMDGSDLTPSVGIDGNGMLHVAWSSNGQFGNSGGDFDIFHRTIDLDDNSMGPLSVVHNSSANQSALDMAVAADGTVHLVWEDGAKDIFHTSWNDGWSALTKVSDHVNDGNSTSPAIALDSSLTAHIVWQELGRIDQETNADGDIYHRTLRLESNGVVLGDYQLVSDNGSDNTQNAASRDPDVVVDATGSSDRLIIAWEDTLNSMGMGADTDIFLRTYTAESCSLAGGWCAENAQYQRVTVSSSYNSESVKLAILESGEIVVAWSEPSIANGEPNIRYTTPQVSVGGTIVFRAPSSLENTSGLSTNVDLLVDSAGNLHFGWQDGGEKASSVADGVNPNSEEDDDIFYQVVTFGP